MKNRIASLFLAFVMLMSLCSTAVARDNLITVQSGGAERFTDVPTSHWAYAYINKVVGSGLFNGKTPTTFEPSNAMTRSQFVMVMARMEGRSDLEGVETQTVFPDVTTTRRAAGPIAWATQEGFVQGFGDGTFKPDSPITRGQFAALIHRYITYKRYVNLNVLDPEPEQFTDAASVSTAFTADVEYARVHGLLTGYSDGTVRSGNPITRAAIAAILARFLDLVTESGYTPLLDAPYDGGDSGDSGTTPVVTPTSYDEVKMNVSGGTHGATPTVAITRNGATVAAGDVKQGDRVTISHKPDTGYVAVVRVRDANNRTVSVTRVNSDSSWFYMPSAMPVTVTVTYERESSGGGGGSSSGGNYGGQDDYTYYYFMAAQAVAAQNGTVKLLGTVPNSNTLENATDARLLLPSSNLSGFTFYAVLKPANGYKVDTVTPTATATNASAPTATKMDSVAGYEIYRINATSVRRVLADDGTTIDVRVSATFTPTTGGGDEPSVPKITVNKVATAWDTTAPQSAKDETAKYKVDSEIAVSDEQTAEAGSTVVLTVPEYAGNAYSSASGYFRYQRTKVEATYKGAPLNVTYDGDKVSFVAPSGDNVKNGDTVSVTAYYTVKADATLNYKVNVTKDGTGTGSVLVSPPTFVSAPYSYTFAEKNPEANTFSVKKMLYAENYKDKVEVDVTDEDAEPDWKLSFVVEPKADTTSTYDESSLTVKDGDGNTVTANGAEYELAPTEGNKQAEVSVTFNERPAAYGYKLTVYGYGDSTATFTTDKEKGTTQDQTAHGKATKPDTVSTQVIFGAGDTLTLDNKGLGGWKFTDVTTSTTGASVSADKKTVTLAKNVLTEITVIFSNPNAEPVYFTVTGADATSGTVTIKAENGKILERTAPQPDDVKAALEGSDAKAEYTSVTVSNSAANTHSYYAMSGTIVTVTPANSSTKITKVDESADANAKDISDKAGYSFLLQEASADTVVEVNKVTLTFGKLDAYELQAAAPFNDKWKNYAYTYSKGLKDSTTIRELLYSLNNNTTANGIVNEFAPDLLASVLAQYKAKLQESLQESVEGILGEEIDQIVTDMKAEKLSGLDTVVENALKSELNGVDEASLKRSGQEIVRVDPTNQASDADLQKARNFMDTVFEKAEFTDPSVKAQYQASKDDFMLVADLGVNLMTGANNLQTQLSDALKNYANGIGVVTKGMKPVIDVDTNDYKYDVTTKKINPPVEITISAKVEGQPQLDEDTLEFNSYETNLDIYISVQAEVYRLGTSIDTTTGTVTVTRTPQGTCSVLLPYSDATVSALLPSDVTDKIPNLTSLKSTIANRVEAQVNTVWTEATSGDITVVMSDVLKGPTLQKVIEGIIDITAMPSLTGHVKSLKNSEGEAPETKKALTNLYNGLVKFVGQDDNYLALYRPEGEPVTLGTIKNGNLVLTLDMDAILKDTSAGDKTVFEQFITLLIGFRTGFATDLQNNGAAAESVIADMLANHFGSRLEVTKWGKTYSNLNADERGEAGRLLAKLLMADLDATIGSVTEGTGASATTKPGVWTEFEEHGYQSVAFSVGVRAGSAANTMKGDLYNAFKDGLMLNDNEIPIGFRFSQVASAS